MMRVVNNNPQKEKTKMKKALGLIAVSMLLATPALALADSQPADPASGGLNMKMKGINLNFGGFIAAESVYRTMNQNSDIASSFQNLPRTDQTAYYQDETRMTARQTRLSILATGDVNPEVHLAGYYEMDFLGAAGTSNSKESNSYVPRIRHLYTTADWDSLGLHLLAGQTWSLVTMNNKGITPRNEVTPLGIEAQYVPGFSWARQPQLRIVKDFDKKLWLALSLENAQTVAVANPATNTSLGQAGANNLSTVTVSQNDVPDIVMKAAYEPGWGHYEIFDLVRTFSSTLNNTNHDKVATNAVGAGVILPLIKNQLSLQVSGMYGKGIGRYGSGQLADVTTDASGDIVPITESQLLLGVTYDPTKEWNIYANYGMEQAERLTLAGGAGYGNSALVTTLGAPGTATFKGQVQRIDQATIGAWWKFYQGSAGKMQAGLQYSHTQDAYFSGTANGPTTADNMIFTSLRYYWN